MTRLAVGVATAGGLGYAPLAPGTVGSAAGILIYIVTFRFGWPLGWHAALLAAVTIGGIWAADRAVTHFGRDDPSHVVIDEVAGQLLSVLGTGADLGMAVAGFALFRLFDVVKPWPARQLESLHGGLGIMADDLMAGIYANLVLQLIIRGLPSVTS